MNKEQIGTVENRNGYWTVTKIMFRQDPLNVPPPETWIQFVGKKGRVLRGGAFLNTAALIEVVIAWLETLGYKVQRPS